MANNISNKIIIEWEIEDKKNFFNDIKTEEQVFDFEKIIPIPSNIFRWNMGIEERKKYWKLNSIDWCRKEWGTKWNCYDITSDFNVSECQDSNEKVENSIFFQTASAAPIPIYNKIYEKYIIGMKLNISLYIEYASEDIWSDYWIIEISKEWIDIKKEHLNIDDSIDFACDVTWLNADLYRENL